jgi:hypothetical protein
MKKSFANKSECHIRRGYAGALLFDGSQWIASEAKRLPSCFRSSRLDSIFVNIRKLVTRSSVNVTCVFGEIDALASRGFALNQEMSQFFPRLCKSLLLNRTIQRLAPAPACSQSIANRQLSAEA